MSFVKILTAAVLVAAAPLGLRAQSAAQEVKKSAQAAAQQSAAQSTSSSPKPAAQAPKAGPPATQAKTPPQTGKGTPATAQAGKPAAPGPVKTGPQASPKAAPKGPASQVANPAVKPQGKPAAHAAAKPKAKAAAKKQVAKKPAPKRTTTSTGGLTAETRIARRDPFESLVGRESGGGGPTGPLPPGKAGLQVSTLRLDGVVKAPNGMIAVVSNPQARTYFLREGDQLYDGRVEKIAMDGVSFHEIGKDAFGKPVERQVNKRIYASAGEQQ